MMQEAAFTEIINKQSLQELLKIENDNINDILGKRQRFAPGEQIIKFKQTVAPAAGLNSQFWFPKDPKYYPKNLHTKIVEGENKQPYVETLTGRAPVVAGSSKANGPVSLVCAVTGAPAKYRDPLSG